MNGDKPKKERAYFDPLLKKLVQNFERTLTTPYGKLLKSLYVYGSYARNEAKCGDIDLLFSVSQPRLRREVKALQQLMLLGLEELNFKECGEYPDCTDDKRKVPNCVKYGFCGDGDFGIGDLARDKIVTEIDRHLLRGLTKLRNEGIIHLGLCYTIQNFLSIRDLDKKLWKIKLLTQNSRNQLKSQKRE